MPDKNINNTTPRRFLNGGKIVISDAVDNFTVFNVEDGSVSIQDGRRAVQQDTDRGTLQTPTLGDEQPSRVEFAVKFTGEHGADTLQKLASFAAVTDGKPPLYTVTITWYDDIGQTAGKAVTYTNCYFAESPTIQTAGAGAERDTARFTMLSTDTEGAWADVV